MLEAGRLKRTIHPDERVTRQLTAPVREEGVEQEEVVLVRLDQLEHRLYGLDHGDVVIAQAPNELAATGTYSGEDMLLAGAKVNRLSDHP